MADDMTKVGTSKTMLIDIPPDIFRKMQTGRMARPAAPPPRQRAVIRGHAAASRPIRVRDKGSTVTIRNVDLQELFQGVYDAGFITDLRGDILDANIRATQFFLYAKPRFRELTMADIVIGFNEEVIGAILENLKNDKFTLIMAQCMREDGTHFPSEISTSRLCLSRKDYLCFFIRDITARREAEDALIKAHDDLEKEVEERSRINSELTAEIAERTRAQNELNAAIEKLREHDQAKSQFVSNVSHELKTPLTSIMYVASNMLKGIAGELPESARTNLEMIQEDCRRLNRTVADILDMSRIEANTLSLNLVSVPFAELTARTTESLKIQAENENLTMSVALGAPGCFAHCDPQKMERVLFNLVKNAIKFNVPNGEIEVSLRRDSARAGWLALDVMDNGMGVAPEYLPRVMERFFRVGEYVSGTGLGLPIAKDIVERHGGELEIASPPPGRTQGFLARIRLPMAAPPTVLIVYRDPGIRFRATRMLADAGYRVLGAMNGDEAISALGDEPIDLLVLDWIAPGMDDGLILARIRSEPAGKHLPFVALVEEPLEQTKQDVLEGFEVPRVRASQVEQDLTTAVFDTLSSRKRLEKLNA